jgi:hypothetical protein
MQGLMSAAAAGAAGGAAAEGGAEFATRVLGMPIDPALAAQVMEMVRGVVGGGTSSIAVLTGATLFTLRICYDMWASSTPSPRTIDRYSLPENPLLGPLPQDQSIIGKDLPPSSIPFQTLPPTPILGGGAPSASKPLPSKPLPDGYSLPENPLLGPRPQDQSVVKLRRPPPLNIGKDLLPPKPLPENPMDPQVRDQLRRPPHLNITTGGAGGDGGGGGGTTVTTIPTPDRYTLPMNPLDRQPDMSIIKLPPPPPSPGGGGVTDPTPLTPTPKSPFVTTKSPLNMWQRTRLAAGGLAAGGSLMGSLAALLLARSKEEKKAMKKEKTKTKTKTKGTKTTTKTDGPCCRQNVRILLEAHE